MTTRTLVEEFGTSTDIVGDWPVPTHCRLASPRQTREVRCPHCGGVVYSRRHRLCGTCSRELPAHFLFTGPEAEKVRTLLTREKARHRAWVSKTFAAAMSVLC